MVSFDMNDLGDERGIAMREQNSVAVQSAATVGAPEREEIDGLAFLNLIRSGHIPPPGMMVLLDMGIEEIERGRVVCEPWGVRDRPRSPLCRAPPRLPPAAREVRQARGRDRRSGP